MSAFILYDTQAIMEKCRVGNNDIIKHSLDLFFDIATVFRRLLVILTQKVGSVLLMDDIDVILSMHFGANQN